MNPAAFLVLHLTVALSAVSSAADVALAQDPRTVSGTPASEMTDVVIRSSAREVLLDVVVRQKNLHLVRKLSAADFTVTEDGVTQNIKTFRFVTGEDSDPPAQVISATPTGPGNLPAASTKLEEPGYVSIVFDQLSPYSRKYAQDAVRTFLARELRSSLYVSVFKLDYRTNVVQNFTNDRELLSRAVDRAILTQSSGLSQDNASVTNQTDYTTTGGRTGVQTTSNVDLSRTPELATAGAETSIGEGASAQSKIVADQRGNSMYQGGMHTITALLNLMNYEASLPGRKTVVYLSEGMTLPPGRPELMEKVVEAARRGHVTFYGIDVRGLKTFDTNALEKNLSKGVSGNPNQAELIQQMGVANTDLNMDSLATSTGGFAVFDTNEIGRAMLRVMQDVRTHYELSYTPVSENYDGHFRKIQVTVNNSKLIVESREGYYALPNLDGKPVMPFELAALQALDSKPAPASFPFRMAALRYRPESTGFQYEIGFEVPTTNITPRMDAEAKKARLHATFLALIKDARGQVVAKVSHEMDESVPEDRLEKFREGQMIFTTPLALPPGRYTVEAAATDPESDRASSKRAALVVGQAGPFSLSDISLVRELQPLTAARNPDNPLEFQGGRVTPELTETARAADGTRLFFVIYPGTVRFTPKVTVQFFHDGTRVAIVRPDVSGSEDADSIPVIASAQLPVGDYEAKVTVEQNGRAVQRALSFSVAP